MTRRPDGFLTRARRRALRPSLRGLALIAILLGSLALFGQAPRASAQFGGLNVSLSASSNNVQTGQSVTFSYSVSPPSVLGGNLTNVTLDYGDGSPTEIIPGPFSAGQTVSGQRSHVYGFARAYTAVLSADASNGASNSAAQFITVGGGGGGSVFVNLNASPQSAQVGQQVTFNYSATTQVPGARITNLTIDFGDTPIGSFAASAAPLLNTSQGSVPHTYNAQGFYTATLTAMDSTGATGQGTTQVQIGGGGFIGQPPTNVAIVNPPTVGQVGQPISFNAATAVAVNPGAFIQSYSWTFGDGGTGSNQSVTYIYQSPGSYNVTLTVTDSTGASKSTSVNVTISTATPPPGPGTTITVQPGWNLLGAPTGTIFGQVGPLYTWQAGFTQYQQAQNPQAGNGYWAFFSTPATIQINLVGPQAITKQLPANQFIMVGNPGSSVATVTGADVVYTYSASGGYQSSNTLQPGQGAWVLSYFGSTVTITTSR